MPQPTATVAAEEQLNRLEDDLRRLKVEMDVFLAGGSKRPPYETRNRIETVIRRLGDDRGLRYEHRFRYNNLCARYNVFRDLWRRLLQQREEGRFRTGYFKTREGAAAPAPPPSETTPSGPTAAATSSQAASASVTLSDPKGEAHKVRELFNAIVENKRLAGEPTDKLSFTQFSRLIESRTEQVKQATQCGTVTYQVTIEDGKVKFTAKGKRE